MDLNIAIFFCQQLDPQQDGHRRTLEKEMGSRIRFFPLPCSGRLEVPLLLKALEAGADRVCVLTCPEGQCRYREGNSRAKKRLAYAQHLIQEIGLEPKRLELIPADAPLPIRMDKMVRDLLSQDLGLSPLPSRAALEKDLGNRHRAMGREGAKAQGVRDDHR